MININLNAILYTPIEHSPTKTVYAEYYMETHTHTHTPEWIQTCVMLLVCTLLVACCLCPFNPFKPVKLKSKAVFQMDTLYSCLLSLVSLSLSGLLHTHTSIVVYICFIATENSSVFNLCCNTITFIPSADHSLIHSPANTFTFN